MSDTNQNNKQDGGDGSSEYIKLIVVGLGRPKLMFFVRMRSPLRRLKQNYGEIVDVQFETVRFLFAGRRINDDETPKQLEMADNDVIEVYEEQTGG